MADPSSSWEILSPARALARLAVGHGPEKTAVEAIDSRRFSSSSAQLTKAAIEENAFDMPPTYRSQYFGFRVACETSAD